MGVMQLLHDSEIGSMTEMLAAFFAEYVGVALSNCVHYRQMQTAKMRTNVSLCLSVVDKLNFLRY